MQAACEWQCCRQTDGCICPCSYNTYNQHYKEVQCFQDQVEPLLYKYGVNFVFFGERPAPLSDTMAQEPVWLRLQFRRSQRAVAMTCSGVRCRACTCV